MSQWLEIPNWNITPNKNSHPFWKQAIKSTIAFPFCTHLFLNVLIPLSPVMVKASLIGQSWCSCIWIECQHRILISSLDQWFSVQSFFFWDNLDLINVLYLQLPNNLPYNINVKRVKFCLFLYCWITNT